MTREETRRCEYRLRCKDMEIREAWDDYCGRDYYYSRLYPEETDINAAWEVWEAEEKKWDDYRLRCKEIDIADMRLDIAKEVEAIQKEHEAIQKEHDLAVDTASVPESTDTHTVMHVRSTAFRRASRDRYVSKAVKRGIDPKRADYMATCSCLLCKWDKKMNVPTIKDKMVALELAEGLNQ